MPEMNLSAIVDAVKAFLIEKRYSECDELLRAAMRAYPHDAAPHNLMGLLLEKQNDHVKAMKHFRAAAALDPTYKPASWNLAYFGNVNPPRHWEYNEDSCAVAVSAQR